MREGEQDRKGEGDSREDKYKNCEISPFNHATVGEMILNKLCYIFNHTGLV